MTQATTHATQPAISSPSPLQGYSSVLVTVVLWASAFPMIRIGLQAFDPIPLAALRFLVAGMIWLAWLLARRPKLPSLRECARLLLSAAIGIAAYNVLLNTGEKTVSAGAASFIVNTVPALTVILAVLFLGERFRLWAWIGTVVSFAGTMLIARDQPGGLTFGAGATLILGAACCQAVFFILLRPVIAAYGAKVCTAFVVGLGAICLSPWLPIAYEQARAAPLRDLAAVIYLGVFPAAIGYASWGVAQAFFGAGRAANFLYLVPVIATLLAVGLSGEIPGLLTIVGGCIAIAGVIVVNARGRG